MGTLCCVELQHRTAVGQAGAVLQHTCALSTAALQCLPSSCRCCPAWLQDLDKFADLPAATREVLLAALQHLASWLREVVNAFTGQMQVTGIVAAAATQVTQQASRWGAGRSNVLLAASAGASALIASQPWMQQCWITC